VIDEATVSAEALKTCKRTWELANELRHGRFARLRWKDFFDCVQLKALAEIPDIALRFRVAHRLSASD
jgi:hypothetical protein